MHPLSTLLHVALFWLSPRGHAVVEFLLSRRGYFNSAAAVAVALHFKNRHQLHRWLSRECLPGLEELGAWIRILVWLWDWESNGTAISRSRLTEARDPAPCYRTVKRLSHLGWRELRKRGSDYVLLSLIDRCMELRPTTERVRVTSA